MGTVHRKERKTSVDVGWMSCLGTPKGRSTCTLRRPLSRRDRTLGSAEPLRVRSYGPALGGPNPDGNQPWSDWTPGIGAGDGTEMPEMSRPGPPVGGRTGGTSGTETYGSEKRGVGYTGPNPRIDFVQRFLFGSLP